jgi:hypothetical protein
MGLMGRGGTFIIGALVLALAAAGVLVWTGSLDPSLFAGGSNVPSVPPMPSVPSTPASREAQLVNAMNEAAAGGGFAASFLHTDAGKWKLADGHRLERFSLDPTGPTIARLTSSVALEWRSNQWPNQGLSVLLPKEFGQLANGRTIEIGVVARMAASNGSPHFTAVYATQQAGNSQWKSIVVKPQFEIHKFTYDVPAVETGYSSEPIVVITSDSAGQGRAVELIGIYVKLAQ